MKKRESGPRELLFLFFFGHSYVRFFPLQFEERNKRPPFKNKLFSSGSFLESSAIEFLSCVPMEN